jgi:hypothetical protein
MLTGLQWLVYDSFKLFMGLPQRVEVERRKGARTRGDSRFEGHLYIGGATQLHGFVLELDVVVARACRQIVLMQFSFANNPPSCSGIREDLCGRRAPRLCHVTALYSSRILSGRNG